MNLKLDPVFSFSAVPCPAWTTYIFLVNWRGDLTVNRSRLQELAQHCNLGKTQIQIQSQIYSSCQK